MKRRTFIITAATLGLGTLVAAGAALANGPGYMQGQMGNMQGQGFMHGQGGGFMQGNGYGPGAYGDCPNNQALDKPLTVDDVRTNLEQNLERSGNDRLKVGKVEDKDDKTITAEIVTVDDSLVRRIEIDKATGRHTPIK
ncbi:MAG: hypothetical protein NUV50_02995 [Rhodospirillales bacterium]|nr:hypothetical protein [Rhodospirillales bacterium]